MGRDKFVPLYSGVGLEVFDGLDARGFLTILFLSTLGVGRDKFVPLYVVCGARCLRRRRARFRDSFVSLYVGGGAFAPLYVRAFDGLDARSLFLSTLGVGLDVFDGLDAVS